MIRDAQDVHVSGGKPSAPDRLEPLTTVVFDKHAKVITTVTLAELSLDIRRYSILGEASDSAVTLNTRRGQRRWRPEDDTPSPARPAGHARGRHCGGSTAPAGPGPAGIAGPDGPLR